MLAAVAPHLPLPVPVPIAVDAEAGCVVLPPVPGTPLLALPRAARRAFAPQLRLYAVYTALEDLAFGLQAGRDRYRTNALAALDELT